MPDPAALTVTRAAEGQAGAKGQVNGGTLPLGRVLEGPWQMAFTLDLGRAYFYGQCGVHLDGEGSLGLRWSHGDNDGDVPANQPRLVLEYRGTDDDTVRETFPPALGPGRRFRLVLGYDPRHGVRGQLLNAEGRLVYDTGSLPIDSAFRPSRLRFEVQPWAGSEVRYEAGVWQLRGISGGPEPSPYVLESGLSQMALQSGSLIGRPPPR
ncbi:MAG: hypothetical protein HZB16_20575 [Armatimonadetes bacterium]|nr:hypothetical protein [Armatimonadota bacterium]